MKTISLFLSILAASTIGLAFDAWGGENIHRSEIQIRDPFILPIPESQTYYMYCAMPVRLEDGRTRQGVCVYASKDLQQWQGPKPVFHFPEGFWADQSVWAPEVHRYRDRYYLFATFTSKDKLTVSNDHPQFVKRGTQILVADSPEGPFKPFANKPHTPENWMSLDGTFWTENDVPYMIFCHEWVQINDGTMELVRLKDDLSEAICAPQTLFKASDAKWVRGLDAKGGRVTDGPFIYRTKSSQLLMIWSSFGEDGKYRVGIACSTSGRVAGPWRQMDEPLLSIDGGHGMIFKIFDDRLVMAVHQPNQGKSRARLFELEDASNTLRIHQEIPLEKSASDWTPAGESVRPSGNQDSGASALSRDEGALLMTNSTKRTGYRSGTLGQALIQSKDLKRVIQQEAKGTSPLIAATVSQAISENRTGQFIEAKFESEKEGTLPFQVFIPKNPSKDFRYPLVVFLHGAGELGDDNRSQLAAFPREFVGVENQTKYPCYMIAPQCPKSDAWSSFPEYPANSRSAQAPTVATRNVIELIEKLIAECNIDRTRVYVTGLSLGGEGAFDIASRRPDLFAAAVPICGIADVEKVSSLAGVALWIFHGERDEINPVKYSREIFQALKLKGATPIYTEYQDAGHDIWSKAYSEPGLVKWLFQQHK